ncbi:MAG: hypothetical protein MJY45_06720 [Bacteroidales bacterium]|nr:hypothetical protein [Bacteroidales bacterium]
MVGTEESSPDRRRRLENWTAVTNEEKPIYNEKISFPDGIRHGSIVGITREEYDALVEAFPFY